MKNTLSKLKNSLGQVQNNELLFEMLNRAIALEKDIATENLLSLEDVEKLVDQQIFE